MGSLRWEMSQGCREATAVINLSKFRAESGQENLDRVRQIVAYISKMNHATIRFHTEQTDYSEIPIPEYNWETSVYGNVTEEVPNDCPKPLGKEVVVTTL